MPKRYLLSCTCGKKHHVEASQAGNSIHCVCGAAIEVPTLRGLAKLEPEEDVRPSRQPSAWGLRGQVVLLGLVLMVLSLAAAGALYLASPGSRLTGEEARLFDELTPAESWGVWNAMREQGLPQAPVPAAVKQSQTFRRWTAVALVVAGVGFVVVVVGLMLPQKQRK